LGNQLGQEIIQFGQAGAQSILNYGAAAVGSTR